MNKLKAFLTLLLLAFTSAPVSATQPRTGSPFNGLRVVEDSAATSYSFWVSAHFYGGSGNVSGYPASTLLANLDMINASDEKFLVCAGDLFKDVQNDIPKFKRSLFDKLQKPLFNAVGNHDVSGNVFTDNYGSTYYYFGYQGDRFIILDTELDGSSISGNQLGFLKNILATAQEGQNIFIFSHRPIWAEEDPELSKAFPDNTKSLTGTNFESDIEPLLMKAQKKSNIYWFSGSLGKAPASFFYHKKENSNIHYVQTAIRDLKRDAMLSVQVKSGKVEFKTVSLTDQELKPLEEYNYAFWMEGKGSSEFNYRLVPYYFELMLTHRYFYYGMGYMVLLILSLKALKWLRQRRKARG